MEAEMFASPPTRGGRVPARLAAAGDERLARLVAAANERAFATLYERYHQPLYRYCRSIVRNDTDAQDALQSAFASAFAALKRGQRDAPLRPWLFRIAHNEAVSLLRRRRPEEEISDASECPLASVEEQVGERARLALLLADLQALPERQRGALVMRELSGLSHEEIAIALGTSVGAAKQTIFEARRSLLEFAEGREMACDEVRRAISDADRRVLRARRVRAHLRDCSGCAAFAAAIPARSSDLRALTPALPAVSAASVLARVIGSGSGHSGAGGLAAGAGASAAGKTVSLALAAKAVAGAVVVATATVGVATAIKPSAHPARHPVTTHTVSPARIGSAAHPSSLGSSTDTGRAARGAGGHAASHPARRSATAPARASAPGGRSAAARGFAVNSSAGAHAGGRGAAPAHGSTSHGAPATAPSRGHSHSTARSSSTAASGHGTRRPTTPPSKRPTTEGSTRSATATSTRPPISTSGQPSRPASGQPTTPTTRPSTTPSSTRPATPTVPASTTPRSAPGSTAASGNAGGDTSK